MKKALSLLGCLMALNCAGAQNDRASVLGYSYDSTSVFQSRYQESTMVSDNFTFYIEEEKRARSKSEAIKIALNEVNESLPFEIPLMDTFARVDSVYSQPFSFTENFEKHFSKRPESGFSYETDLSLKKVGLTLESGNGIFAGFFTDIDIELKASLDPDYEIRLRRELTDHIRFEVSQDEKETKAFLAYHADTLDVRSLPGELYTGLVKFVTFQK